MKADLSCEIIGAPARDRYPWVAEVYGRDGRYGLARHFVPKKVSYRDSNKRGTRGIYAHWILDDGCLYEACLMTGWGTYTKRWITVTRAGDITDLTKEEAEAWIDKMERARKRRRPKPPPRPRGQR